MEGAQSRKQLKNSGNPSESGGVSLSGMTPSLMGTLIAMVGAIGAIGGVRLSSERDRTMWRLRLWRALLWALDKIGILSSIERTPWLSRFIFNIEYKAGSWDYLDTCRGDPYAKIILRYAPSARILDLGCGTAKNVEIEPGTYSRYVGVDLSEEAIRRARLNTRPNSTYEVANILDYEPAETFDVVLLREVMYYLPIARVGGLLQRLADCLSPDGVIVLQLWEKRLLQPVLAETQAAGLPILEEISSGSEITVVVGKAVTKRLSPDNVPRP